MVTRVPPPPSDKNTPEGGIVDSDGFRYGPIPINRVPVSKFFDDAAATLEVADLLTERGEMVRELSRRMLKRLPELALELLREEGA